MTPVDPASVGLAIAAFRLSPTAGKLLERMLGPLADELGQTLLRKTFADRRRRLAERATAGLNAAGIEPQQVPPKLLLPIFEHAGVEEDAGLAEKWAALLANAANGNASVEVRPIYVNILASLTPLDARILEIIADADEQRKRKKTGESLQPSRVHGGPHTIKITDFKQAISTLISFGLVEQTIQRFITDPDRLPDDEMSLENMNVRLTVMGEHFLQACHMPPPKRKTGP